MNAHTKQQQDKVFETDFIDSQKSDPTCVHLLALSHVYIYIHIKRYWMHTYKRKEQDLSAPESNTLF